ncbi:restriction endonuclease [Rubellimicrobium rubrum]|uniref:Restriction endonuclease n=1 Tax=Rubellimicrobium rubrum TaxID=2585369 RepID=A0A5C4MMX8_9RHOB|nr:restriction endonuclease [Rubellimicrobium rubrum]TNC45239.1 restriction endonuclease [Rubellimicrobium rubrum]
MTTFTFAQLPRADLQIDAVYQGGRQGNAGDDPLGPLLKVSNSGGFRYRGKMDRFSLIVLTTGMADPDWPDRIDRETGILTYYGDNKVAGQALHATPRRGNEILRRLFEDAHGGVEGRRKVPPILVFATTRSWRDVEFLGLVVPGTSDLQVSEDLVAVWHTSAERRFQNYRARFTVLDTGSIPRRWIDDIISGADPVAKAPSAWHLWRETGQYRALRSRRSLPWRTRVEQQPADDQGRAVIAAIHAHFADDPHRFEHFAARLVELLMPEAHDVDVTRPSRDGGRDAVGKLRIGRNESFISVDFSLEAKCYGPGSSVGVRDISRLISRLRHRQFGVLVTTSHVDQQAYREIKEDQHPIVIVAARDIVELLRAHGRADLATVKDWLNLEFGSVPMR